MHQQAENHRLIPHLSQSSIDTFTDILFTNQLNHIGKATAFGDFNISIVLPGKFIRNELHEQNCDKIVFILAPVRQLCSFMAVVILL